MLLCLLRLSDTLVEKFDATNTIFWENGPIKSGYDTRKAMNCIVPLLTANVGQARLRGTSQTVTESGSQCDKALLKCLPDWGQCHENWCQTSSV